MADSDRSAGGAVGSFKRRAIHHHRHPRAQVRDRFHGSRPHFEGPKVVARGLARRAPRGVVAPRVDPIDGKVERSAERGNVSRKAAAHGDALQVVFAQVEGHPRVGDVGDEYERKARRGDFARLHHHAGHFARNGALHVAFARKGRCFGNAPFGLREKGSGGLLFLAAGAFFEGFCSSE